MFRRLPDCKPSTSRQDPDSDAEVGESCELDTSINSYTSSDMRDTDLSGWLNDESESEPASSTEESSTSDSGSSSSSEEDDNEVPDESSEEEDEDDDEEDDEPNRDVDRTPSPAEDREKRSFAELEVSSDENDSPIAKGYKRRRNELDTTDDEEEAGGKLDFDAA